MLIYGIRWKLIATRLIQFLCLTCGQSSQAMHILQRYIHIFWIPVLPINKKVAVECLHCKRTFTQPPPEMERMAAEVKKSVRAPIWMYSGLAIIALLIGHGVYQNKKDAENTKAYVQQPAVGDVAVMEVEGDFRVFKISGLKGDLLEYRPARYHYDTGSAAKIASHEKIGSADYLVNETFTVPLAQYQAAKIYSVER